MKIRPMGAELFHEGGRTDRQDEANSRFTISRTRLIIELDTICYSASEARKIFSNRTGEEIQP
jgi:hypothetical protein